MTTKITSANITQSGTSGISSVAWQAVQTTGFTAVAGRAYPCNTTSAAFTVTLPASPAAGNVITLTDYAGTFATNNLTINPNGGKIRGSTDNAVINTSNNSVQLVYVDSTQGWIVYGAVTASPFIPAPSTVEYLVVAGGGGGAGTGAGGGAGGVLSSASFSVSAGTPYTVTVGGSGSAGSSSSGGPGSDSVFSTVTSKGGGGGGREGGPGPYAGGNGGSGGGGGAPSGAGTALGGYGVYPGSPYISATRQGYDGGTGTNSPGVWAGTGGGGGAGGLGASATNGSTNNGGVGIQITPNITGTSPNPYYGGGGGSGAGASGGTGGLGGGGNGGPALTAGSPGGVNTGGGGGGGGYPSSSGGSGGSGIVVIAYQNTYANLASIGGGLTYTLDTTTRSGYKVYKFTAGTGTISW